MARIHDKMERLKTLRSITWMLAAMLLFELGFLAYQVRPQSTVLWITIILIAISGLYLARLALGVIKELKDNRKE